MRIEDKGHFFTYVYFPAFICLVLTRPRYQVSVYRTIGPLVLDRNYACSIKAHAQAGKL